jgi:hypothetical protein
MESALVLVSVLGAVYSALREISYNHDGSAVTDVNVNVANSNLHQGRLRGTVRRQSPNGNVSVRAFSLAANRSGTSGSLRFLGRRRRLAA